MSDRSTVAKRSNAKPQTVAEKLGARAKKFVALRKTEKATAQPSSFSRKRAGGGAPTPAAAEATPPPAAAALPHPWTQVATADGTVYYYNTVTQET